MASVIGTVLIRKARVYPLDATNNDGLRQEAYVPEGEYYVMRDVDAIFWMMDGFLNQSPRSPRKIGDGMYLLSKEGDEPTNIEVHFPSRIYGVEEFKKFMAEDFLCRPGIDQRLVFRVTLED